MNIHLEQVSGLLNLESAQYGMAWLRVCVLCACVFAWARRVRACWRACVRALGCCVWFCVPGSISYLKLNMD